MSMSRLSNATDDIPVVGGETWLSEDNDARMVRRKCTVPLPQSMGISTTSVEISAW